MTRILRRDSMLRDYPSNYFLVNRFNCDIDTLCTFCGLHTETFFSFILELSLLQTPDFCSFVRDHIMPSFQLCFENVLFIFFTYDMSFHKEYYLINFLLLLAKFSIHKCKYGDYKPLFLILKSEVKQYPEVERVQKYSTPLHY